MAKYKETAEYANDLMEHFYNIHSNQILILGKEHFYMLVPREILHLLEYKTKDGQIKVPECFKKIPMKEYSGSEILFVLREVK